MHMFMPVGPAILTRNERHFGWIRNSVFVFVDLSFDRKILCCL